MPIVLWIGLGTSKHWVIDEVKSLAKFFGICRTFKDIFIWAAKILSKIWGPERLVWDISGYGLLGSCTDNCVAGS